MAKPVKFSKRNRPSASVFKIILGTFLLFVGIVVLLNKDRGNDVLSATFQDEPVKFNELTLTNQTGDKPQRIIIPNLNIDLEVKEAKEINGFWEVFQDTAGWGEGSGLPGQSGNQVIFAHAKEGLFLPLQSIKLGHSIYILTGEKYYNYEVVDLREVYPGQTETIAPTSDETLTLYTCSGFADSKRLVVTAKRV